MALRRNGRRHPLRCGLFRQRDDCLASLLVGCGRAAHGFSRTAGHPLTARTTRPPVITPRTTRLVRAADLRSFRSALAALATDGAPLDARDRLVIVPTRAAAAHPVLDRLSEAHAEPLPY